MHGKIGEVAGQVWQTLKRDGAMALSMLPRKISGATNEQVMMAVGWLAREGQVDFENGSKITRVMIHKR